MLRLKQKADGIGICLACIDVNDSYMASACKVVAYFAICVNNTSENI